MYVGNPLHILDDCACNERPNRLETIMFLRVQTADGRRSLRVGVASNKVDVQTQDSQGGREEQTGFGNPMNFRNGEVFQDFKICILQRSGGH